VNGQALPLTVFDLGAAYQIQLVSGALTLNSDGTYALQIDHVIEDSGNIRTGSDSDAGRWSVVGDSLTLASVQDTLSRAGNLSGGMITLSTSTSVLVLQK
jgi:hypothetical protein